MDKNEKFLKLENLRPKIRFGGSKMKSQRYEHDYVIIKFSLLVLLIFLMVGVGISSALASLAPVEEWSKTFGGTGSDIAWSVQQTTDGGYIVAGRTWSYGANYPDVWLIKTDSNGNEEWNKTFGGTGVDEAYSVQQTIDGGYIVAGRTSSYGAGWEDVWLIKADSNGNEEWNKTFGGTGSDIAWSVQQTTDGGYIVAGWTDSYGAGGRDVWLIKADSNGNEEWNKTFGGTGSDIAWSVQQTTDGGYIVAGWTDSYGAGGRDVWLIKADSNGNEKWNKTFGGTGGDVAFSVQQTTDGGYIVAGRTLSYGVGGGDVWLIKADSNGNEEWNKTFGGTGSDWAFSVQQTTDGGYIVAGLTDSYGAGGRDVWLIKADYNGNEEWNKTFGSTSHDEAWSVQQTTDGGYIVAGYTESYGAGSLDVWLIKLALPAYLETEIAHNASDWADSFYPNNDVYALNWEFITSDTWVDIYVVPDGTWQVGDTIPADASGGIETVRTNQWGYIPVTPIWGQPLSVGEYDIIIDVNQNGKIECCDAIDSNLEVGFSVTPTPVEINLTGDVRDSIKLGFIEDDPLFPPDGDIDPGFLSNYVPNFTSSLQSELEAVLDKYSSELSDYNVSAVVVSWGYPNNFRVALGLVDESGVRSEVYYSAQAELPQYTNFSVVRVDLGETLADSGEILAGIFLHFLASRSVVPPDPSVPIITLTQEQVDEQIILTTTIESSRSITVKQPAPRSTKFKAAKEYLRRFLKYHITCMTHPNCISHRVFVSGICVSGLTGACRVHANSIGYFGTGEKIIFGSTGPYREVVYKLKFMSSKFEKAVESGVQKYLLKHKDKVKCVRVGVPQEVKIFDDDEKFATVSFRAIEDPELYLIFGTAEIFPWDLNQKITLTRVDENRYKVTGKINIYLKDTFAYHGVETYYECQKVGCINIFDTYAYIDDFDLDFTATISSDLLCPSGKKCCPSPIDSPFSGRCCKCCSDADCPEEKPHCHCDYCAKDFPEFSGLTIVIPVVIILGLVFLISRRKQKR